MQKKLQQYFVQNDLNYYACFTLKKYDYYTFWSQNKFIFYINLFIYKFKREKYIFTFEYDKKSKIIFYLITQWPHKQIITRLWRKITNNTGSVSFNQIQDLNTFIDKITEYNAVSKITLARYYPYEFNLPHLSNIEQDLEQELNQLSSEAEQYGIDRTQKYILQIRPDQEKINPFIVQYGAKKFIKIEEPYIKKGEKEYAIVQEIIEPGVKAKKWVARLLIEDDFYLNSVHDYYVSNPEINKNLIIELLKHPELLTYINLDLLDRYLEKEERNLRIDYHGDLDLVGYIKYYNYLRKISKLANSRAEFVTFPSDSYAMKIFNLLLISEAFSYERLCINQRIKSIVQYLENSKINDKFNQEPYCIVNYILDSVSDDYFIRVKYKVCNKAALQLKGNKFLTLEEIRKIFINKFPNNYL